ncbi:hypothetical protein U9M48_030035 [Paspalum notatum var. saurae]|uniref:Peptidase A1 domain-containing protein n=1 Tax=Paspalum notatum var. saurae TaxID=547442 RepID=A0AAQ3U0P6_PASNO
MVIVLPLLLLLLLGSTSPTTWATADDEHEFIIISDKSSLKSHAACSAHRGTWAPLYRHHGPCSPSSLPPAAKTTKPSLADLLRRDQLRVDHIHWRVSADSRGSVDRKPVGFEAAHLHDEPVIQVTLGSAESKTDGGQPSRRGVVQTVVLDTASDLPWVRCAPRPSSCPVPPCHAETADPSSAASAFFDPTRSGTYFAVACSSPDCDQLGRLYGDGCGADNQCRYRVPVPHSNASSSSGTYGSDLLAVDPTTGIPFKFGCSHAESDDDNTTTAGVLALGGGPESLVSQTAASYGSVFSYCIPAAEPQRERGSGFFVLGAPSLDVSAYVLTPMLRYQRVRTLYRVLLRAIAVDGQLLNVTPAAFAAGSVLDSRTAVTRLPPTAYQALRDAFRSRMAMYREAPPKGTLLDTCYDFAGAFFVMLPRIALVFDRGAVVELDRSAVLFHDCLAFAPNSDDRMLGILGNVQQQTMEVLYNVAGDAVGFRRGAWVPLYRPLGPCSPSFRGAAAEASLADVLRQDRLRVRHIHRKASGDVRRVSKRSHKEPVTVEETQVHHQAAISVGVGTEWSPSSAAEVTRVGPSATDDGSSSPSPPAVSQTVVLDTASDVPWVRCVACPFAQCADYDPTRSSTYAAFPCNSSACKQLGRYANGCINNQCQYIITVTSSDGGGDFTSSGTYSSDQLTINSASPVPGFRFGCSRAEQGSFDGQAGGVMALGRGAQSLTAQTSSTFGAAFSYCLPPSDTAKGFFRLGGVPPGAYRFVMTPMLRDRRGDAGDPTLYRALLVGITVDGRALNVGPDVFAAGGTVLDSRTVITRLPLTAYGALRAAFRDRMAHRAAPPREELDTCYDLRGVRRPRVPRVALVFDGDAVVELDRSGVLFDGCLAFAPNDDDAAPSILGNVQLQTIEVLHDVGGRRIGFRRDAC